MRDWKTATLYVGVPALWALGALAYRYGDPFVGLLVAGIISWWFLAGYVIRGE